MSDQWQHQLRLYLDEEHAEIVRRDAGDPALDSLAQVLAQHDATMKCQFDAFADYVAEAEAHGTDRYPLYAWTKATIEDPAKKAKHIKSFALHVKDREVYTKDEADALEADLQPLVDGRLITRLSRHDTNPANSPQPPERFRKL
jgi:hypothetical protein